jgi:two-component system sensor histidine kinase/response regulator
MDGYVAKPLQTDELFSAISEALRGANLQTAGTQNAALKAASPEQPRSETDDRSSRIPTTQHGPIDWSIALKNTRNDEQLLSELGEVFLKELPRSLNELREFHVRGDAAGVQRVAHTLKGQYRIFGARSASESALQVETHAGNGDLDIGAMLTSIERESGQVREAMLGFVDAACQRRGEKRVSPK